MIAPASDPVARKEPDAVRILRYLLIFVPLAVLAEFVIGNDLLIFATLAIALVPLAGQESVDEYFARLVDVDRALCRAAAGLSLYPGRAA
jgi:hypothetical protein